MPLFRVWREQRDMPWPALLDYWGVPNLQVINREVHAAKCAGEANYRRKVATELAALSEAWSHQFSIIFAYFDIRRPNFASGGGYQTLFNCFSETSFAPPFGGTAQWLIPENRNW
jgi:hypothetical protein